MSAVDVDLNPAVRSAAAAEELRSLRFRKQREASWRRLEELLAGTPMALSHSERRELPSLYRSAVSSLSVARSIALDRALVSYLEALAFRAYFVIYGPRKSLADVAKQFIRSDLPRAVRQTLPMVLLAGLIFALGIAVGWRLVSEHPESFFSIVPDSLADGRSPFASTEMLRSSLYTNLPTVRESLHAFAAFLFHNNASVAILCFALGFALGIPTLCLLFYNGTIVGAMYAAFASHGLGPELLAWLSVHGTTEVTAILMAGAAGLTLGHAVLFPAERQSRLGALRESGRRATSVAMGAFLLLLIAAVLEGVVRQAVTAPTARLLIGISMAALLICYFALGVSHDDER